MAIPYRPETVPVSLVVPVLDEESSILSLLDSIDAQTVAPREVVVVDGGSRDRTVEMVRERAERSEGLRLVVSPEPASPGQGRNLGVSVSTCDWLAFTDAGIRVEPQWLATLWSAHLMDPDAVVVYGNYEFDLRSSFQEYAALAYCMPKRQTPAGLCRGPSVVSLLLTREVFEATGGFPPARAGEDTIFLSALEGTGARAAWAPGATVWWRLRPDLASTAERFRLYSHANALAGLQRHWHHRLVRSYAPVGAGLVLAAARSPRWLLLSAGVLGARAFARVHRHDEGQGWRWKAQPTRLAAVTAIMLVTDAASVVGWWQASRERRASPVPLGGSSG